MRITSTVFLSLILLSSSFFQGCNDKPVSDDSDIANKAGIELQKQGKMNEAVKKYNEAIKLNPDKKKHMSILEIYTRQSRLIPNTDLLTVILEIFTMNKISLMKRRYSITRLLKLI